MDRLKALRENTPTIFAPNCWGGLTYHSMGLEFCSPLINMHEPHDEYLRFLSDPEYYIDQELQLQEMHFNEATGQKFPITRLDDITLWMNHYNTFDEAKSAWERRKARIKWNNLFVMFFDDDPKRIEQFLSLPYERKICFVPWETHIDGLIPVPYKEKQRTKDYPFWEIINNMALGYFVLYDPVELILNARYSKIGDLEYTNPPYKVDTKVDTTSQNLSR